MHNKLIEIICKKRDDLNEEKKRVSLETLQRKIYKGSASRFKENMQRADGIGVIAEIKFASPTNPSLGSSEDLLSRAKQYGQSGADAISVITEKHFFKGDLSFVTRVKQNVSLPVLQKDFVIDPYQIYQAKEIGSDALLLIARLVDEETLQHFVSLCQQIGIEPVVEIASEEDLEKSMKTTTNIIAVNARDLDTFTIDLSRARALLQQIPDRFIKLGFSGVLSGDDAYGYEQAGANGILIGTSLMKVNPADIITFIQKIKSYRRVKVKICGIRTFGAAKMAVISGTDFLGFNFVPTSKRRITVEEAKRMLDKLRAKGLAQGVKFVGIFQNQSVELVNTIAEKLDLDFVQLHGEEDVEYMNKVRRKIIKKIVIPTEERVEGSPSTNQHCGRRFFDSLAVAQNEKIYNILLDRKVQGYGDVIDFERAKIVAKIFPTFFAGGLTPENVADVVQKVRPFAVDVAGGIETEGEIDSEKVRAFIQNVKNVRHSGDLPSGGDSRIDNVTVVKDSGRASLARMTEGGTL